MLIDIGQEGFSGIYPGISTQRLPANAATIATNCDFRSGSLRPLKAPLFVLTPVKAGTKLAIYRFSETAVNETDFWFHHLNDTDYVRGMTAGDTTERTYYTEAGQPPKVTDSTLALTGGGTAYPINSYLLGIPIPAASPSLAVSGTGTGAAVSRTYVYTDVSGWGEEGPPCAPSAQVSVQPGQTVTLSGMSVAPAGAYNIVSKRIYRAISGISSAGYQFVAEIPIAQTSYVDTIADTALTGSLESAAWIPPPTNMIGLTGMRNGMMAGFVGQDVYFCEPFKPWAWPARYRMPVGSDIVGMKSIDSSLIVATKTGLSIITGTDPQSMDLRKSISLQSCSSKRSMVNMGETIMAASPDGMVAANEAGAVLVTEKIISQAEWRAFKPESIIGAHYENKYIGSYNTGTVTGSFIIDFTSGTPRLSKGDTYFTAAYNDLVRDALYLQVGNDIVKYNEGTLMTLNWESGDFVLDAPRNLSCARVDADSYPCTFKYYSDNVLKLTKTVADNKPFRLPSGFLTRIAKAGVSGSVNINKVYIASNMGDLRSR